MVQFWRGKGVLAGVFGEGERGNDRWRIMTRIDALEALHYEF